MVKEMCWLPTFGNDGDKILHLRTKPNQPWQPYTAYPDLSVPDYRIPEGSKGWATYQKLMKEKWTLVPSDCPEGAARSDRALQNCSFSNQDLDQPLAS